VRRVCPPYNMNGVALACLPPALEDRDYILHYVEQVRRGRESLRRELTASGIRNWPSEANFVLAWFGESRLPFIRAMRERGVLVRDRNSDPGCAGCVRITLGADSDNERLFAALKEAFTCLRLAPSQSRRPSATGRRTRSSGIQKSEFESQKL